jgi:hypothetical protein
MKQILKSLVRPFVPRSVLKNRERLALLDLMESNLRLGVPGAIKRLFVRNASEVLGYPTFVETGTYQGNMAAHAAGLFRTVHTIELQPALAAAARVTLQPFRNVTVHEGNSAEVLSRLLPSITAPAIFWLDAHYSGGVTARGAEDTPVLQELRAIARHPVRPVAVFIDDARVFGMDEGYPSLEETFALLREIDPGARIGVCSDIVWASPMKLINFEWRETEAGVVEIAPH